MKKIISLVVALFIAFGSFSVAGAASVDWKNAFKQKILNSSDVFFGVGNTYGLMDMDLDGTPELLMSSWGAYQGSIMIYSLEKGKVKLVDSILSGNIEDNFAVYLNKNTKKYEVVAQIVEHETSYLYTEYVSVAKKGALDSATKKFAKQIYDVTESGSPKYYYYVDGKKVRKSAYDKAKKSFYSIRTNQKYSEKWYDYNVDDSPSERKASIDKAFAGYKPFVPKK